MLNFEFETAVKIDLLDLLGGVFVDEDFGFFFDLKSYVHFKESVFTIHGTDKYHVVGHFV
jgi:hypothetical protein